MTECPSPPSCASWNGAGGMWFKIDEQGLLGGTVGRGRWGSGAMIARNLSWEFAVPPLLRPGEYLLRTETVAMHGSAPQFYPNCAQVRVTGAGTARPPAGARVAIPGVYSLSGEFFGFVAWCGILANTVRHIVDPAWAKPIWSGEQSAKTTFKIPGPAVWKGT
jgi:hypothetical protein